jgi:hypothetical protein
LIRPRSRWRSWKNPMARNLSGTAIITRVVMTVAVSWIPNRIIGPVSQGK